MDRPSTHVLAVVLAVLPGCVSTSSSVGVADLPSQTGGAHDAGALNDAVQTQAPIRSEVQLQAWLAAHAGKPTPLDQLSPGARERFLLALNWGPDGLGGLDPTDIADELGDDDLHSLLRLFGQEDLAATLIRQRAVNAGGSMPRFAPNFDAPSPFERRYNRFYRASVGASPETDPERTALAARFDAAFPEARDSQALRHFDAHELRLLGRAIEDVATFAARPADIDAMQRLFAERERRAIVRTADVRALQDVLLVDRRFDAARQLAATHPLARIAALPDFVDPLSDTTPSDPTVWRMSTDGGTLTRTPIDLDPTQILVTAGCHFSRDAAEDISADPLLGPAFAGHAHWLMPAPGIEDIDEVRAWNARFPHAQAEMIHARSEWSVFPDWTQPTFYIVRDGRVVDSVRGWPRGPDGNRRRLIDALAHAGLLDQSRSVNAAP